MADENLIKTCCICGNEVETKKILPFRDLIGSGVEIYNMHIARCDNCGFIFQQNPLTAAQLENRYKNESKYEFDSADNVFAESDDYVGRCHRQKHFIDENICSAASNAVGGGRGKYFGNRRGVWLQSQPLSRQETSRH